MQRLALQSVLVSLVLAVSFTTAAAEPEGGDAPGQAAAPKAAAPAATPANVAPQAMTSTTIDPNIKQPVCRRYVPTGSRIATRRCDFEEHESPSEYQAREDARRNLEDMRALQQARDQARATMRRRQ